MSLRVFVVALCLAASALGAHGPCHMCVQDREYRAATGWDEHHKGLDGFIHAPDCEEVTLNEHSRWRLPRPTHFEMVHLTCEPPATSYAAGLRALNVFVDRELILNIPPWATVSAADLAGLPPIVTLIGNNGPCLHPGALTALDGIHSLTLIEVNVDELPKNVNDVNLQYTGIEKLSLDNVNVSMLTISESSLEIISGQVPQLHTLSVISAPALRSLSLTGSDPALLRAGLVRSCPALATLRLQEVRSRSLPDQLLHGAKQLTNFTFSHGDLTTLPENLFEDNQQLTVIDLSFNMLESLPREIFFDLHQLRELRLNNNRLTSKKLHALQGCTALATLSLSWNPLSDICHEVPRPAPDGRLHATSHRSVRSHVIFEYIDDRHLLMGCSGSYGDIDEFITADEPELSAFCRFEFLCTMPSATATWTAASIMPTSTEKISTIPVPAAPASPARISAPTSAPNSPAPTLAANSPAPTLAPTSPAPATLAATVALPVNAPASTNVWACVGGALAALAVVAAAALAARRYYFAGGRYSTFDNRIAFSPSDRLEDSAVLVTS